MGVGGGGRANQWCRGITHIQTHREYIDDTKYLVSHVKTSRVIWWRSWFTPNCMGYLADLLRHDLLNACMKIIENNNFKTMRLYLFSPGIWNKHTPQLIHLVTRQSEMANTSPHQMPVLGNIHPINIEHFNYLFSDVISLLARDLYL